MSVFQHLFLSLIQRVSSHRTLVPIQFPPHVVALGGLYSAALLASFERITSPGDSSSFHIVKILSTRGGWETKFQARVEDLEGEFQYIPYSKYA